MCCTIDSLNLQKGWNSELSRNLSAFKMSYFFLLKSLEVHFFTDLSLYYNFICSVFFVLPVHLKVCLLGYNPFTKTGLTSEIAPLVVLAPSVLFVCPTGACSQSSTCRSKETTLTLHSSKTLWMSSGVMLWVLLTHMGSWALPRSIMLQKTRVTVLNLPSSLEVKHPVGHHLPYKLRAFGRDTESVSQKDETVIRTSDSSCKLKSLEFFSFFFF